MPRRPFHELAVSPIYQRIFATVDAIPSGRVATYGGVARAAGLERRARMVGRALAQLPAGSRLPWHRVVAAGGVIALRGDGAGEREQRRRLKREGVKFDGKGRVVLARHAWTGEVDSHAADSSAR